MGGPIFSGPAAEIPPSGLDQIRERASPDRQCTEDNSGANTIGIFVFSLYDGGIGRATRPNRTGGKRWHQGSGRPPLALPLRPLRRRWPTRRRNTAVH